jgi:hypothetical protein
MTCRQRHRANIHRLIRWGVTELYGAPWRRRQQKCREDGRIVFGAKGTLLVRTLLVEVYYLENPVALRRSMNSRILSRQLCQKKSDYFYKSRATRSDPLYEYFKPSLRLTRDAQALAERSLYASLLSHFLRISRTRSFDQFWVDQNGRRPYWTDSDDCPSFRGIHRLFNLH